MHPTTCHKTTFKIVQQCAKNNLHIVTNNIAILNTFQSLVNLFFLKFENNKKEHVKNIRFANKLQARNDGLELKQKCL
jgi:hypothetical protein